MLIAHLRRFTDIPFAEEIAIAADAATVARKILGTGEVDAEARRHAAFAEARYKCIIAALERLGLDQVVEFGSGLAFRAAAMASATRYVDTDLPAIIAEKRRIVAAIPALRERLAGRSVAFVAADILSFEDVDQALHGLDAARPVGLVHEGLLGYLTLEEKGVVAANLRRALERHGGAWVTPDLATRSDMEEHARKDANAHRHKAAVTRTTGRDFAANAFANDAHIEAFFADHGLQVDSRPQVDGSFELSALRTFDLPDNYLDQFNPRLWTLTLR